MNVELTDAVEASVSLAAVPDGEVILSASVDYAVESWLAGLVAEWVSGASLVDVVG